MKDSLKLYWCNSVLNFGDFISKEIVDYFSRYSVSWGDRNDCDLVSIGSVLDRMANSDLKTDPDKPLHVWGTGVLSPIKLAAGMDKLRTASINYHAVRGPLTASLLDNPTSVFGDPGLLIPNVVPKRNKQGKTGIITHHSFSLNPVLIERLHDTGNYEVIKPDLADHLEVVKRISQCERIISASLHGLIIADAYAIPSAWWMPRKLHSTPEFKFHDYALAIERPLFEPLREVAKFEEVVQFSEPHLYYDKIVERSEMLIEAFPREFT